MSLQLTWLGTAGFKIKTPEAVLLTDPFLSRKGKASPFTVDSLADADFLFLGHGHFDHIADVPKLSENKKLKIAAAPDLIERLKKENLKNIFHSVDKQSNQPLFGGNTKVYGFESHHVHFDSALVTDTVLRCGFTGCLHVIGLGVKYPKGGVRSYLFEVAGKKILFLSSAGANKEEIKKYRNIGIDILLLPMQGHSKIHEVAGKIAIDIEPKVIIPHHHDDFYPPMSIEVSLEPLRKYLKSNRFKGSLVEIPLFGTLDI